MKSAFSKFQNEIDNLLQEVNILGDINIQSLDDLRSGIILSKLIANPYKPDIIFTIPCQSKDKFKDQWKLLLRYLELAFPSIPNEYFAEEIVEDLGVLSVVSKRIVKYIKKFKKISSNALKNPKNRIFFVNYEEIPNQSVVLMHTSINEDEKLIINKWLQDLKIIPPGVFTHEFVYRIRNGTSLFEMLRKLDNSFRNILDFNFMPESMSDCIKNINKIFRLLRANKNMNQRYLYASAYVYDGNREVIYGLVYDIKLCFTNQPLCETCKKKPSHCKSLNFPSKTPSISYKPISIHMKNNIIEWISSLNLLHLLYTSDDIKTNTIKNSTLLCKVIEKIFHVSIGYIKSPRTENHCLSNMNSVLNFLTKKAVYRDSLPKNIQTATEDLAWEILWEIMNTCYEYKNDIEMSAFKKSEVKIIRWLKHIDLIDSDIVSIFELVPFCQNGVLLCRLAILLTGNHDFKYIEFPVKDKDFTINVHKVIKLFSLDDRMNQRFIYKEAEILRGDVTVIMGLLEDMHEYGKVIIKEKRISEYYLMKVEDKGRKSEMIEKNDEGEGLRYGNDIKSYAEYARNIDKIHDVEVWVKDLEVKIDGLGSEILNEFKGGVLICEILEKALDVKISDVNYDPKTNAEALGNVRKALDVLYGKFDFPLEFKYCDDLIVQGDGNTVRSLLVEIYKHCFGDSKHEIEEVDLY
ncbi:hypothetical protein SteCoe_19209 [Stentor coeruleus]|uniref:Calponin-homology (CH) domain-containing protein n=1 Tax=Stentor coeruleus TaxID=5963 RepID=A0A1R2BUM7_9CILI|nr:hypothetical protein SteCoe_19209 [Stentor coeruleus]